MTSRDDTDLPNDTGDEAEASHEAQEVLAWIKRYLEEERYSHIASELLSQILCLPDSSERGGLLRFAVESLVERNELVHALSLVTAYPVTREGADETEDVGFLFLLIAQQSQEQSHLVLVRDFVRQHEKVLETMDAAELFLELLELTRDKDDLPRVQRRLAELSDVVKLYYRLRIVALTQDEKELSRLCREIRRFEDPTEADQLQGHLEATIAKLPKAKMNRLIPLLPSEVARRRTREAHANYSLN